MEALANKSTKGEPMQAVLISMSEAEMNLGQAYETYRRVKFEYLIDAKLFSAYQDALRNYLDAQSAVCKAKRAWRR